MKRPTKIEKIPSPISLAKKNIKTAVQQAKPYKWGSSNSIDENSKLPHIQNLKQEFHHLKSDVQKLLTNSENDQKQLNTSKSQIFQNSVREELLRYKSIQQQLQRKIIELNIKLSTEVQKQRKKYEIAGENKKKQWDKQRERLILSNNQLTQKLRMKNDIQKQSKNHNSQIQQLQKKLKEKEFLIQKVQKELNRQKNQVCLRCVQKNKQQNLLAKKYENAMIQFKKLQSRYGKYDGSQIILLKNDKNVLQQQVMRMRLFNEDLRKQNKELDNKLIRLKQQMSEQQKNRYNLIDQLNRLKYQYNEKQKYYNNSKLKIEQLQRQKQSMMNRLNSKIQQGQSNIYKKQQYYENICKQLKLQIINKKVQNQRLIEYLNNFDQKNKYLQMVIKQKQTYIQIIQTNKYQHKNANQIQQKYQQIIHKLQSQNQSIIKHYQSRLTQIKQQTQKYNPNHQRPSNFNQQFKQFLKQIQQLKIKLKNKDQQIFSIKSQLCQHKRSLEILYNQIHIQKIKKQNQIKILKTNHQIVLQSQKHQIQLFKKRIISYQTKIISKQNQIKKKDQFLKNIIQSKLNQPQQNKGQYYLKQILKIFDQHQKAFLTQ